MSRITTKLCTGTKCVGCALALVLLSLSAFTAANAQATAYKYGYCYGTAGNPRGVTFTKTFVLPPSNDRAALGASFYSHLSMIYGGYTTDENDCPVFTTAAEAEAARKKLRDDIASRPANGQVVEIDWIPPGASLASGAAPKPIAAAPATNTQAQPFKYGFCYAYAGRPPGTAFSGVFVFGPTRPAGWLPAYYMNYLLEKIGNTRSDTSDCPMFATAAEAEAKRKEMMSQADHHPGYPMREVGWVPEGATAVSGPAPTPKPAPVAPKPQTPAAAPVAATPAASTAPKLDMWGRPIPTTAWWVCETHIKKNDFYVTDPFFADTNNLVDNDIYRRFNDRLIQQFHEAGTSTCNKYQSEAEAKATVAQETAAAHGTGYQAHKYDWAYTPGAAAAAAPAAAAPKPATAVAPKPAPVAVAAAKPATPAPAPAKPAAPAAKPGVWVICRSEWNTDMRRFYNPPVDGRGAGYPEWQASYGKYLASHYKFQGSNYGCGEYPTREAAQADFESWVVNARASPTVNGLPSPVIITNWNY